MPSHPCGIYLSVGKKLLKRLAKYFFPFNKFNLIKTFLHVKVLVTNISYYLFVVSILGCELSDNGTLMACAMHQVSRFNVCS